MIQFHKHDVENAYRKLKSYIYYDNYFIFLRERIAKFEATSNFENRIEEIVSFLNNIDSDKSKIYFNKLINDIDYTVVPKSYEEDDLNEDFIVTNKFTQSKYELEKVNFLIDAPVEIHVISVLWILHEGFVLSNSFEKSNFAYKLQFDKETNKVVDGLRLFKPYFEQYQKWRDNAIDAAQHFVKEGTDVLIVSLDIKQYFYNIDLTKVRSDFESEIKKGLKIKDDASLLLTNLLFKIHEKFQSIISLPEGYNKETSIPIGLLSSGVIGNWFLRDFDKKILDNLSPSYYGRYVDDITIVLSNTSVPDNEKKPKEWIFNKFFVKRDILEPGVTETKDKCKDNLIDYSWIDHPGIQIQKNKTAVYAFNSKESKAVLDKFKRNIEKNSSAFWFLPDEEGVNNDFDESVYELTYSDTVNKLRSIQGIKQSKYGASVFLAKKIKLSLLADYEKDEKTSEQILTFFKGRMNLEFNSIWEKALVYFLVNNEGENFLAFLNETIKSVDRVTYSPDNKIENKLKKDFGKFIKNCIALSIALRPDFYSRKLKQRIISMEKEWVCFKDLESLVSDYRKTNLLRHNFVVHPLLNFCVIKKELCLCEFDLTVYNDIDIDVFKFKFSPRFVYLHEFIHFFSFKRLDEVTRIKANVENEILSIETLFIEEAKNNTVVENSVHTKAIDHYFSMNDFYRKPQKYAEVNDWRTWTLLL